MSEVGTRTSHVAALDGLRGIAAVVVIIRHSFNAVPMPEGMRTGLFESPLAILLTSQGAVQLFFVLSGWVLAASLERRGAGVASWLPFYVQRICRIHIPFVAAALGVFALSRVWSVPADAAVTPWLANSAVEPSAARVLASLAFPGKAAGLLPVGWTLTIEMIYSFALPVMVLVARPARGAVLIAIALLGLATPWRTAWYGLDFALGVVAYQERTAISAAIRRLPPLLRAALPVLGAVLVSAPIWSGRAAPGAIRGMSPGGIAVMGVGSVLLVCSALSIPLFARILGSPAGRFLGRISYASYLLHRPLLTVLAPLVLVPTLLASGIIEVKGVTLASALGLIAIVVAGSLALSIPFHRWVEQPAIALGRRLARSIATPRGASG